LSTQSLGASVKDQRGAETTRAEDSHRLIDCSDIEKTYRTKNGDVQALVPTSLHVNEGEFVSVVGPSGCGKSTLLMLIAGLLPVSGGRISIGGHEVKRPYTDLGIVFQEDLLMEWRRAMDNVLLQGEFRGLSLANLRPYAEELFEMVGLSEFGQKYPYELSGGMRQRVAICRALVHNPPILLMDEPFGALDALTRDQLNLDIQGIWARTSKTVLFITHSISEAVFLADRVLVFGPRPGRIVDEINIDLPRPRHLDVRETPRFGELARRIRGQFESMGILRDTLEG
jgi:NitT/TauT family transport system ATP-binding protein